MTEDGHKREAEEGVGPRGTEEPPFAPEPDEANAQAEGGADSSGAPSALGRRSGCLKAVATGCLTLAVLVAVLGFVVFRSIRGISTELVRKQVVRRVEDSGLPKEQQAGLVRQVNRVAAEFRRGRLTVEDVQRMAHELAEGPVISLAWLVVAELRYLNPSDLDEEEKQEASLAIQRFARGVSEGRIPRDDVREAINRITWASPETGERRMKESLSVEELREFLRAVENAADAAGVPKEPFQADVAAEARKVVDRFLDGDGGRSR